MFTACTSGQLLTLGGRKPQIVSGPDPVNVVPRGVNNVSNGTLTEDMLEIYFSSDKDIWTAKRADSRVAFEPPVSLDAINTIDRETSPAISSDGLTLWFATDRLDSTNLDIWMSKRPSRMSDWPPPVDCASLNSPGDDLPRPPGNHGLILPLSSSRNDGNGKMYEIFFASRSSVDDEFGPPVRAPDLPRPPANSSTDPFLTDDGLGLFYSGHPVDQPGDIVLAEHGAWGQTFSTFEPLDSINTQLWRENDPWLSPDGMSLYFTSNRAGIPDGDGGTLGDGGDVNGEAHPDRIYRVIFDIPWAP